MNLHQRDVLAEYVPQAMHLCHHVSWAKTLVLYPCFYMQATAADLDFVNGCTVL